MTSEPTKPKPPSFFDQDAFSNRAAKLSHKTHPIRDISKVTDFFSCDQKKIAPSVISLWLWVQNSRMYTVAWIWKIRETAVAAVSYPTSAVLPTIRTSMPTAFKSPIWKTNRKDSFHRFVPIYVPSGCKAISDCREVGQYRSAYFTAVLSFSMMCLLDHELLLVKIIESA